MENVCYQMDPMVDSRISSVQIGPFLLKSGNTRSKESQQLGEAAQDYLTYRHSAEDLVFCICDGVGLSYSGGLAAKLLGDTLIDWMWREDCKFAEGERQFQQRLTLFLSELTVQASRVISDHPLPHGVSGMLREVLEEKRQKGSQSMFVCGKVSYSSSGTHSMYIAWLGDTRIRLWGGGEDRSYLLKGSFDVGNRWSSSEGIVDQGPFIYMNHDTHVSGIEILQVYTDGLKAYDHWNRIPNDEEYNSLVEDALNQPDSDDITFLELRFTDQTR
ncbi:MAG TPA: hypothetical protein VEA58_06740 [Anaerovoracaceae bacterium]|nr:hypothetical protein [Anaerovoracaceae bacterium]